MVVLNPSSLFIFTASCIFSHSLFKSPFFPLCIDSYVSSFMLDTLNRTHVKDLKHSFEISFVNNTPFVLIATSSPKDFILFTISTKSLFNNGSPSPAHTTLFNPCSRISYIARSIVSFFKKLG